MRGILMTDTGRVCRLKEQAGVHGRRARAPGERWWGVCVWTQYIRVLIYLKSKKIREVFTGKPLAAI